MLEWDQCDWIEGIIVARSLGRCINMRLSYPHKTHHVGRSKTSDTTSMDEDFIVTIMLPLPGIILIFIGYGMSVVGSLCLNHSSRVIGRTGSCIQSIHHF